MRRNHLNRSLFYRIVFVFILLILVFRNVNIADLISYFTRHMLIAFIIVQPLVLLGLSLFAIRFAILVRSPAAPFIPTFKAVILSIGMNAMLPGRVAELLKPTFLMNRISIPLSVGLSALFLERMADLIIFGIIAIISIGLLLGDTSRWLFIILMAGVIIVLVLLPRMEETLLRVFAKLPWHYVRRFMENFFRHAANGIKSGSFYKAFLFSATAWLCDFVAVVLFLNLAGSIQLGFLGTLVVFTATLIGAAVPALPGGLGTYEAAAVFSLKRFGYSFEEALALAIILHASLLLLSIILSVYIVMTEQIGISSLIRQITALSKGQKKS